MKGVSNNAIIILNRYVPNIYIIITLYKLIGSGFSNIQAKILKTVLSTREDKIVDKLFLNHKYFSEVIFFRKL